VVHLVPGNPPLEKVEPNILISVLAQPFLKRLIFLKGKVD
jgi:hypothetical protein